MKNYMQKYGIKKDDAIDAGQLQAELESRTKLGAKGSRSRWKRNREKAEKEHLVTMFSNLEQERQEMEEMDEEEKLAA